MSWLKKISRIMPPEAIKWNEEQKQRESFALRKCRVYPLIEPYFRQLARKHNKPYVEPILTDRFFDDWNEDRYKDITNHYIEILKKLPNVSECEI